METTARLGRGALAALSALLVGGCVERLLIIRSEPPGARVWVDAVEIGRTPIEVPFEHYGTREVLLRIEGSDPPRGSARTLVTLSPPWYERFPIDVLSEHLWPATIVDTHEVRMELPPLDEAALMDTLRAGLGAPEPPAPTGTADPPR